MNQPKVSLLPFIGNIEPAVHVHPALVPTVSRPDLAAIFRCTEDAVAKKAREWKLSVVKIGKTDNYLWEEWKEAIRKHGAPEASIHSAPKPAKVTPKKGATTAEILAANGLRVVGGGK